MKIQQSAQGILDKLDHELAQFPLEGDNRLLMIESSFFLVDKSMEQLKRELRDYRFQSVEEEINFFKNWMTKLLGLSIFYGELFHIESEKPIKGEAEVRDYYRSKLSSIQEFLHRNAALNNYLVMEKSHLDKVYFIRDSEAPIIYPDLVRQTLDSSFCTVYTLQFAKLTAMGRLMNFVSAEVINTATEFQEALDTGNPNSKLLWTGSKVDLVELIYALKTTSVINHGSVTVAELAVSMGHLFGKELKGFYKTFEEIRGRRSGKTFFLDRCKTSLDSFIAEYESNE